MSKANDKFKLLAVDNNQGVLESIRLILGDVVEFTGSSSAEIALDLLQTNSYDIVITDYNLNSDVTGTTVFKTARKRNPLVTAALMTANDSAKIMKDIFESFGGIFIEKPFCEDSFAPILEQARRTRLRLLEITPNAQSEDLLERGIIAETPSVVKLLDTIRSSSSLLSLSLHMTGPTGTGKSTLAELIHRRSGVKGKLVTVNCAGLEELAMSRLFGHVKGSFTGAMKDHDGFIKQADGGTLFLDELHLLSKDVQGKLLRVLQDGVYQRLGDTIERTSRFRLITAASVDVRELSAQGQFLPDLWYRISGKILVVPPLAERKACIPRIVYKQLRDTAVETNRTFDIEPAAMDLLASFSWEGNIRDLSNSIRSMCTEAKESGKITSEMVREDLCRRAGRFSDDTSVLAKGEGLLDACKSYELTLISQALRKNQNNISNAAKALRIPRSTLRSRIEKLGVRI